MKKTVHPSQFEIWRVQLNPVKGSEQRGIRPCLILQTNAVQGKGNTTLIAPFTTKKLDKIRFYETHIAPSSENGLREASKVKFDQIRVIDKTRLIKKIGSLETKYFQAVLSALFYLFDMRGDFRE